MQAINIEDLRSRARRRLPKVIFEFIDGGAQDETTLRANREDFQKWRFRTRVLTDVSTRDQSITLFGQHCASPLILAPTGLAGLLFRRGELAAARAAEKFSVPYCLSTMATCSIEEITTETTQPKWFQLYVLRDRGLTKEFIERARASRCTALVLTVDTKVQGPRERDMRNGFTVPPRFTLATMLDFALHFSWLFDVGLGPRIAFRNFEGTKAAATDAVTITEFIAGQYDLTVNWRDVEWFKSAWGGPVLLKGILSVEDAKLAALHGADGVIVSNHGGRQLEGAVSAVHALPAIADAVADRLEVLLDGGIRRGADVVRARALGAKACMIGRAWLYGLASSGQAGVERALEILRDEIDITLTLLGRPALAEVDRDALEHVY
ncbi:MAG TPA: alpha-hydroxy acid oxidase [Burkholderiales bacterium]|nr:alpha-hydroxy acid oxidase [Burkholderiales bacterium]